MEKLLLTPEESQLLQKKLKAIEECEELFPKTLGVRQLDFWARHFTLKDYFQDELIEKAKRFLHLTDSSEKIRFDLINCFAAYNNNKDNSSSFSDEEKLYLIKVIEDYMKDDYRTAYLCSESMFTLYQTLVKSVYSGDDAFLYLINSHVTKLKISGNIEKLQNFINQYLLEGKIEDVDKVLNTVSKRFPHYANFPVIIMNKNISREKKIEAIKKTYRKSDMPKYKKTLTANISDWNDVDTFIDATITQNGRIKDKRASYIKFFKDLFVPGFGYIQALDRGTIYDKINGEAFREKYSYLFYDASFLKELIREAAESYRASNHGNYYSRKNELIALLKFMLADMPIIQRCKLMTEEPLIRDYLPNDYQELFQKAFEADDKEGVEAFKKMFLGWFMSREIGIIEYSGYRYMAGNSSDVASLLKSGQPDFLDDIEKRPFVEIRHPEETFTTIASGKTVGWRDEGIVDTLIDALPNEKILSHNYFGELFVQCGINEGVRDGAEKNGYYGTYSFRDLTQNIETYEYALRCAVRSSALTDEVRDAAIHEYLTFYMDPENLQKLFDLTMELGNSEKTRRALRLPSGTIPEYVVERLTARKALAEDLLPASREEDKEMILNNISEVINNLKLIFSIV